MKNILKRADGRWQYRKSINGNRIYIYAKTQRELLNKIKHTKINKQQEKVQSKSTIELIWEWFKKYKENLSSNITYKQCIAKHFEKNKLFDKNINKLTYIDIEDFIQNKKNRVQAYCYYIIKGTFEYAENCQLIKYNFIPKITKPKRNSKKGTSFSLKEQKLILENLDKTDIKYEILFYLLIGCRRTEAKNITIENIDFDNLSVYVPGTKTRKVSDKRYVPISKHFAEILKNNFNQMFTYRTDTYSQKFKSYLKQLNIKGKKLHDLRHTFSTNLYYLGVPDKERQYYMGHSSIVMTNDVYTHLDPNIKKDDILNLYKDLYPQF